MRAARRVAPAHRIRSSAGCSAGSQAADSYEHHAVPKVVSAISTATTGSIHFLRGDSADFSDMEANIGSVGRGEADFG